VEIEEEEEGEKEKERGRKRKRKVAKKLQAKYCIEKEKRLTKFRLGRTRVQTAKM